MNDSEKRWGIVNNLMIVVGLLATVFSCILAILTFLEPQRVTNFIYQISDTRPEPETIIVTVVVEPTPLPIVAAVEVEPTALPTSKPTIEIENTVWDFNVQANRRVGNNGFIQDTNDSYDLVIRLFLSSNTITGEYIGASRGACSKASIEGAIQGDSVYFVTEYDGCCDGNAMEFVGSFNPQRNHLKGTFKPVDIPIGRCELWYADITATKRE